MNKLDLLGERTLYSTSGERLQIVIYNPRSTGRGDFECVAKISGATVDDQIVRSVGLDKIQAVLLVLRTIGSELDLIEEAKSVKLSIGKDCKNGDHGFPSL